MNPRNIPEITSSKGKERLAALTAYDAPTAAMLDEAGIDILLVGDSVANVVYGFETTLPIGMDVMIAHTRAVARGAKRALVVGDMPFGSYQPSIETATRNAVRFLAEGWAHAVKLEGGTPMADTIRKLVEMGIPVMGHVGLTPQSVYQLGGYRMRGKKDDEAKRVFEDARQVAQAGAFAVVLECVEPGLASAITKEIPIPTIGIGSGSVCDGEILVVNDLMGLTVGHVPKFVTPLADLRSVITKAAHTYVSETKGVSR